MSHDPTPGPRESEYAAYFAHQAAVQVIHGVVIPYRITLDGPRVDAVHAELDDTLPAGSTRITTGEAELIVHSDEWAGRHDELQAHVTAWIVEHVNLRAARPRPRARRYDPVWMEEWRKANPGGRR